jgi:16S rRNA (guanine966-N2)-methyltransferase
MRVIGGFHRSRKLLPPRDESVTRPITDRVKQSLFDRLWAMGVLGEAEEPRSFADSAPGLEEAVPEAQDASGANHVLDIFAGTGSLGIEALSRGCGHCVFIEKDRTARTLLEQNLAALDLTGQATVIGRDALTPAWVGVVSEAYRPVRLVFLDPPFALTDDAVSAGRLAELMAVLAAAPGLVARGGVLVLRTSERAPVPAVVAGWDGPVSHGYGSMVLHFFTKA